jgi:CRP/FNR family transcriptional regulator, cyclic AMP receptor protein
MVIAVLEFDGELAEAVPASDRGRAIRASAATAVDIPPGPWTPEVRAQSGDLGLLILDGLLMREVRLGERTSVELLGTGDLLRPWDEETPPFAQSATWRALTPVRIALLTAEFAQGLARWPAIQSQLLCRVVRRSRWLACSLAIAQLPRVDARLLLLFWQIAHRWGKVTPEGVRLPLRLTHEMLAMLIGARRPTVTTALGSLEARGRLQRRGAEGWLLPGRASDTFDELLAELG